MNDLRKPSSFYALLFVILLLAAALPAAQAQEAEWTFIMFSASDNDLEAPQLLDINEMEWVGSSANVNLVVQIDRAEDYDTSDGDWTDTRRYYLMQDSEAEAITSDVIESLGEVNVGDPQVLIDYVLWAIENYPAQKYALVMEDHGGGWTGFGWDESHDYDPLTMLEIDQALKTITESAGIQFELIGFDACLMSQYDVVKMLAPYGKYALVASETEPGFGWAYDMFLPSLENNPAMDGAELGQVVVDSYMEFYTTIVTDYDQFDLNVIDLGQVASVDSAMNAFARAVQNNAGSVMRAIGDARNNTQLFGGATNPDEADSYSSVDLIHFLKLLAQLTDNAEVRSAATDLMNALEGIVIYHQASGLPNAYGMAVYFPRNQRVFAENNTYIDYLAHVPYLADWQAFMQLYYGETVAAIPPAEAAQAKVVTITNIYPETETLSILNPPVIEFHLDGKDILEVSYSATLVGDGFQIMLNQSPLESASITPDGDPIVDYPDEPSDNTYAWGVDMPVVMDNATSIPTLLLFDRTSPDTAAVSGLYIPQNGAEVTAYLLFDMETQAVKSVWGSSTGGGAPYEIKPKAGDQFLPTWRFLDENNRYVLEPAEFDPLVFSDTPFTYAFEPAPSGSYDFTILVEDIAGNLYSDSVTIGVDNEGLDMTWRGFTDTDFGVYFQYPWDWPEFDMVEYEDGSQLLLSDPEGNVTIRVDTFDTDSNETMLDTAVETIQGFGDAELYESDAIDLGGYPAYSTDYTLVTEDGIEVYGTMLSVYVPDTELGYLIEIESYGEDAYDLADTVYYQILDTIEFFAPVAAEE